MKRVVVIADLHCGHRAGLTPPDYQSKLQGEKYYYAAVEQWNAYKGYIESLKPVDILVVNGDAIDGKGRISGSSELITADTNKQVEIACECIKEWDAPTILMTYGTGYHVSGCDDSEEHIAKEVGALEIRSQLWVDVEGTCFDFKHHVGGSTIPHGKGTPISKERLWNFLWTEHGEQVKADVLVRSHVHYYYYCGEISWLAMTTPALQGQGSKFGARRCSGHVDFGVVRFDVDKEGYSWGPHSTVAESQKRKPIQL